VSSGTCQQFVEDSCCQNR